MKIISDRYQLSETQLFWILQITGWFGLALMTYFSLTLSFNQTELPYVLHPFVQSLIGIVVSWPLRAIFQFSWNKSIPVRVLIVTVSILVFSLAWTFLRLSTFIWMTGEEPDFFQELMVWYYLGLLVFIGWAALYHGIRYYRFLQAEHENLLQAEHEKQKEQLRRQNAERLAREAQLKMLQYQLNPHFLFNTMNAITSLVNAGRNAEAGKMIDSLSAFLRDALKGDPLQRVTLREELGSLQHYLSIEQTRFGDRLSVEFQTDDADPEFRVPGLILQPLAENVIKHAVRPASGKITLSVKARMADGRLEIEVADDGPGIPGLEADRLPEGGLGLQNVYDRLENIYGTDHEFLLQARNSGGLLVRISVPPDRGITLAHSDPAGFKYG